MEGILRGEVRLASTLVIFDRDSTDVFLGPTFCVENRAARYMCDAEHRSVRRVQQSKQNGSCLDQIASVDKSHSN